MYEEIQEPTRLRLPACVLPGTTAAVCWASVRLLGIDP